MIIYFYDFYFFISTGFEIYPNKVKDTARANVWSCSHVVFSFFFFPPSWWSLLYITGSFSLQSYFGLQKSTTLDGIKTQVNLAVEDPAKFKSAKLEVSGVEGKKASAHKLKHRDMNILTPSGFWHRHPHNLDLNLSSIPLVSSLSHTNYRPSHSARCFWTLIFLQCQISPNVQTC